MPKHSGDNSKQREAKRKTTLEDMVAERTAHLERTKEELRVEKERARRYLDTVGAIVVALDATGRISLVNKRGCGLLGYEEDQLIGANWFNLFVPKAEQARVREAFASLMEGQISPVETFHNRIITRNRGERWITWSNTVLRDEAGQIIGTLGSGEDVTEQLHAAEAVRASELQLRTITDALPVMVARLDRDGRYLFNNAAYLRFFGVAPEVLKGSRAHDVLGARFTSALPHVQKVLAGEETTFENQLDNQHGQVRDVVVHFVPARDDDGGVDGFYAVISDITERKQLAQALQQSQKMEAVGQLASGIAHDFNNLLMGIGGCANVALSLLDPDNPARIFLEEIRMAAASGGSITRQLLAFSHKSNGELTEISPDEVLARSESMLRRLLGTNIVFSLDLQAKSWRVQLAQGHIEQIIMNLVVNARDAMPSGGTIEVATRELELASSECNCLGGLEPGAYVAISVQDTGTGMDASTIERIYEPFFTTKEVGKGTGLGLSTVYAIVSQHGGCISVRSELDEGTTFTLYLPRHESARPEAITPDHPAPKPLEPHAAAETVLVVEDNRLVMLTIRSYLDRLGFRVLSARDGHEALRIAQAHSDPLSLLICDMVMPGMPGSQVAKAICALHPETKSIYVSAHSAQRLAELGHFESGETLLQKPFGEEALAAKIREVLGEHVA